jgi:hypothetical protein
VRRLSLRPEQLRQELIDDDLSELTPQGLRVVAETLAANLPPQNEAVAMLAQHPELSHAFVTADDGDPDYVHVVVAIRNKATCKLRIPKSKYGGPAMLEWIEQHTSGDLT